MYGRVIPSEEGMRHTVLRQPIGPVAAFSPWNFPMSSPGRKVAGALSSGCSIILKASEETPAGAVQLVRAFHDAGLPPGVLNLVFGNPAEISSHLIPQSSIRLITFTGSIPVGKQLAEMAGRYMKPAIMELGGHAPVIVCDDVDPAATAAASVTGKSRNAGQVCVAPTRFFVQESIYKRFADTFAEKAAQLKVGNGLDPSTQLGPLANSRRIDTMENFVADAKSKGASVLAGGQRIGNSGYFFPLTVLADVPDVPAPCAMNHSVRWRWSTPCAISMRRSRRRTRCPMALRPMHSRDRRKTPTGSPPRSKSEISRSITLWRRLPKLPSAA